MSNDLKTETSSQPTDPISESLIALVRERRGGNVSRHEVLLLRKDAIAEARKEGIGHHLIAKHFVKHGIKVTWHDVLEFCVEVLGEAKSKRRRRRSVQKKQIKPSPSAGRATSSLSSPGAIQSKSAFRENHKDL